MHADSRHHEHIDPSTKRQMTGAWRTYARSRAISVCTALLLVGSCGASAPGSHAPVAPGMAAPESMPSEPGGYAGGAMPSAMNEAEYAVATSADMSSASVDAPAAAPQARMARDDDAGAAAQQTGQQAAQQATQGGTAGQPAPNATMRREALVIEGRLELVVESVVATAEAIRAQVEGAGGRVTNEQLSGAASWQGSMEVKLPPAQAPAFLTWLEKNAEVRGKSIQSTDVSRQLFDQQIALDNLEHTLQRMRALLDRPNLSMQEILVIEQQLTRLRGEIESIKGQRRFLEHRVAYATLTIQLEQPRPEEPVIAMMQRPKAKLYPGPRLSTLMLIDANGRERVRLGGGVEVRLAPQVPIELDVFADADGGGNAILATFGGVIYSDFMGRGRRRWLNPYLELRVGYGKVDGHAFAFGAGAGVELFKHKYVLIDANTRLLGLAGESFETVLVSGAAAIFAF